MDSWRLEDEPPSEEPPGMVDSQNNRRSLLCLFDSFVSQVGIGVGQHGNLSQSVYGNLDMYYSGMHSNIVVGRGENKG
jgi:hypothetical protein